MEITISAAGSGIKAAAGMDLSPYPKLCNNLATHILTNLLTLSDGKQWSMDSLW
jgi:hypothetical protein